MLKERLNGFAMCSIEKDILDKIDLDIVLEDFHQEMLEGCFKKSTEAL